MTIWKKRVAYLAVGTLAVAGLSGAFGQTAMAADDDVAPTSGPAFDALAKSLLADEGVQAVALDANDNVVIYTTAPLEETGEGARTLAATAGNVTVTQLDAPIEQFATDEVVGGAGYIAFETPSSTSGGLCSVGFSGWDEVGDPVVISAGHCTKDNAYGLSSLTLPTGDPAGGGDPDNADVSPLAGLGTLAFSQFGGPGNTPGAEGDTDAVDISVIDLQNDDLTLLPEVTDWTTASSEDLAASTLPVRSVGAAVAGEPISKSGRTTGFTEGTVQSVNGWANVSGREVYGFMSVLVSKEGDSGGSMIQGDKAVGVLSGGTTSGGVTYVWGANLEAGLEQAGGDFTVALYLDAPVLTAPADGAEIYTGTTILGSAPANSTLEVDPSEGADFEVPVDGAGNWSFAVPGTPGEYSWTVQAVRGFNSSASTSFSLDVLPAPLSPVVIGSPFDGQRVTTILPAISGTGEPGATLTLSGAVDETLTVPASGAWSVPVDLGYGLYSVTAVQTRADASASPPVTIEFDVVPVAPAITDPKDGARFDEGHGPTEVHGTGLDGATVTLWVNGAPSGSTTVVDGTWRLGLAAQLAAGEATFSAAQSIDGVTSDGATNRVTIVAANSAVPAGNGGSSLANTGADAAGPLAAGGIALLLAAAGALLLARRLKAQAE